LRAAKRDDEARGNFGRALQVRPNFAEAAYQLTELQFQHGELAPARAGIDAFIGRYDATADLLLLGCASRAPRATKSARNATHADCRWTSPGPTRHVPWRNSIATPVDAHGE